jgi:hypothetical protein
MTTSAKKTGLFTWLVVGLLISSLLMIIISGYSEDNNAEEQAKAEQTRSEQLTPEQLKAETEANQLKQKAEQEMAVNSAKEKQQQDERNVLKYSCRNIITHAANDPNSVEFINTEDALTYNKKHTTATFLQGFRAKNGFNALTRGVAECQFSKINGEWSFAGIRQI